MEEWKDIIGYEGYYQVSNHGRVRGVDRSVYSNNGGYRFCKGRLLTVTKKQNGYIRAELTKCNRKRKILVHRLVASAFIPNPSSKKYINHINGDKADNRVENVEWCTHQENMQHALATGLRKRAYNCRTIVDTCLQVVYQSIEEAAKANDISIHTCRRRLKREGCLKRVACWSVSQQSYVVSDRREYSLSLILNQVLPGTASSGYSSTRSARAFS